MNFLTFVLFFVLYSASMGYGCSDLSGNASAEYNAILNTLQSKMSSLSACLVPYQLNRNKALYKKCISAIHLPKRLEKHILDVSPANAIHAFETVLRSVCSELRSESSLSNRRSSQDRTANDFSASWKVSGSTLLVVSCLAAILVIFGISFGIYKCAARSKAKESIENPPETPYVGMNLK